MNRRSFLGALLAGVAAFFVRPKPEQTLVGKRFDYAIWSEGDGGLVFDRSPYPPGWNQLRVDDENVWVFVSPVTYRVTHVCGRSRVTYPMLRS